VWKKREETGWLFVFEECHNPGVLQKTVQMIDAEGVRRTLFFEECGTY
jgi:hypothetical protein